MPKTHIKIRFRVKISPFVLKSSLSCLRNPPYIARVHVAKSNAPLGPGMNVQFANGLGYWWKCCQLETLERGSSLNCDAHDRTTGLNDAGEGKT